ncbi:transcriptional regulator [Burkholderia pseudomallei]|nr:transcriptional regulator [Burkholderia pseudomallei]CAJ3703638.1 transcriptional regulator [Burkholderia pseudomallei]CAJ3971065.1 transcriptional regulator [Burkholderia pseudomallei]CAJ3999015.1 transcriptional regulator [Burkholderia pseudomallei]CAJ4019058.1 transcriptional regulator [Burkholderia pseudomallei]
MGSAVPKLYRISDVMVQLSVSRATIYRMVAAGKLRLVKIGTQGSRITAESVEAVLAGTTPEATGDGSALA